MGVVAPSAAYEFPSIAMEAGKVVAQTTYLTGRVSYKLGAKAEPLTVDESTISKLDCSGFSRLVLWHAAGIAIPDGSPEQHAWCEEQHFKASDFDSALLHDGAVRIAFLTPEDGGGIGHVMLVVDGETCECYGARGVGRRGGAETSFRTWQGL